MYKEMRFNCLVDVYDLDDEEKIDNIQYQLEHDGCTCDYADCKYLNDYNDKTKTWYCEKLDKEISKCECDDNTIRELAEEIYDEKVEH